MAHGSQDGVVRLLSVGAVVPRKGFDVLIARWRRSAICHGADDCRRPHPRPQCRRPADADIARHALENRVAVLDAVSPQRLAHFTGKPTCSCSHRISKATAWPMPSLAHGLP